MDIEDNLGIAPIIMAVMLYVIHGRAEHIPETITFENLIDIAVICDHYRCGDTISPWDKVWMKQPKLEKLVLLPAYLDWLFIAHVFRNQELFGKITKELARNVVRTEDGKFGVMIGGDVRKMHNRLPEEIICKACRVSEPVIWSNIDTDDMANEHAKAVKDIIRVCHQTYDMYQDDSTVWCKHGQEYCDRIVFAFLHMELSELGLLEKENMHRKQPDIQGNRSFDSTVDNFKNLWTSIRQNLGNVTVDGIHHLDCIEPAEEKVKMFDPCLGNIASLTLESYQHFGVVKWWSVLPDDIDIKPPYARTDRCAYVVICPYGDLEIYYSSLGIAFRVSSHAVRTASPILRHLLERACGFLTQSRRMQDLSYYSIQRHKLTIDEAYNPVVLSVVFYALHGLGKKIPHKIDCEHLYDLAVLCEKYQCASIMLPWCLCWIEGLRQTLDRPMDGKWLYIAWVFGLDDIFQTLTRWFTANAFTEGYGDFLIIEDKQHIIALGKHIPREILCM
jgi:hypothetical protein